LFYWCFLSCTVLLAGCSPNITVREVTQTDLLAAWRASVFDNGTVSQRTQQTLRRLNLMEVYARQPDVAQSKLHALAVVDPQADYLFALAEINYLLGQRAEKHQDCEALARFYLCAGYAFHFLFHAHDDNLQTRADSDAEPATNPFDPRHRLACDLYNAGLSKCIRAAQRIGQLDASRVLHLPTEHGDFQLAVVHHGFAWKPEEFGPLLFCSDYEVVGLENHYGTFGLGVPLIGKRVPAAEPAPGHAFYPKEVSFPVTAFFRFEGGLADLAACRAGRLELYNPLRMQSVQISGRAVALQTDLTTPLAYFLSKTDLEGIGLNSFFRADRLRDKAGIYLFEPYQPGKIPVLLTHGILSTPLTWTRMYNDLRADPVLRENFQFWFFLYPTGNPYLATAADLRQALASLRADLDPHHQDPALDEAVLMGHSMGGLISKLLTQDSGDDFWKLLTKEPFDQIKGTSATIHELDRVFYFERHLSVKRVIFLATPHRGSRLSEPTAFVVDRFLRLPRDLRDAARDLVRENPELQPELAKGPEAGRLPTSLDLLTPGSPALELLARRGPPPGVRYHSIIGIAYGEGDKGSDGIVPYRSAHVDGVDSELIVPASHSAVHDHPQSMLEVRRILREHLEEVRQRPLILTGGEQTR
jgi:pimeloyl-ACP methyl ester carboxylesterase